MAAEGHHPQRAGSLAHVNRGEELVFERVVDGLPVDVTARLNGLVPERSNDGTVRPYLYGTV